MTGRDRLEEAAGRILALSDADQTEAVVSCNTGYLTRFAGNSIHQNVGIEDISVTVRAVCGTRTGVASTNVLDEGGLKKAAESACAIARSQADHPGFTGIPPAQPQPQNAATHCPRTADYSADQRARAVGIIAVRAGTDGVNASGAFTTEEEEVLVASSEGTRAYQAATKADLSVVTSHERGGTGFARSINTDVSRIDPAALAEEAVSKAVRSAGPVELERGAYPVFLEPYAATTLVNFLSYLGFGAKSYRERRSFLSGRMGERITGGNVTIFDDGCSSAGMPMPFDFEGVPKKKVTLIENGTAAGIVYDSAEAALARTASTGHALPAGGTFGPIPMNLFMQAGRETAEDMLAGIERGVYVTRFHYTNVAEPLSTTITGMTRDGTFLIENGRITRPVKNVRFTQNILEALGGVRALSAETKITEGLAGVTVVPALVLDKFRFTSETEF